MRKIHIKIIYFLNFILSVINDENRTKEDIYNWIQSNLYDNILEEPEFTMMPTHTNYLVASKIIDDKTL
jgi:hypothetical protein